MYRLNAKTVGIIGESGCGKSTLARVFAGLPPTAGTIKLDGNELAPDLRRTSRNELPKVQFVYQMANTALNPRQRISDILGRPINFMPVCGQNQAGAYQRIARNGGTAARLCRQIPP